ncbi:MAG: HlyD family efflux transporter periplasmic adaptor subunit [Candidatus Sumerlaeota bacterium]|nr:HlyD family efflux transporter periplasmic adaptor subunit [Candidatus Sumerlaeota bacterium]
MHFRFVTGKINPKTAWGGLLLFCVLSLAAVSQAAEEEGAAAVATSDLQAKVRVVKAEAGELPLILRALGMVAPIPRSEEAIVNRNAGVIAAVEVRDGDMVESGTILARLDERPWRESQRRAETASRAAEADLKRANDGGLAAQQAELDLAAAKAEMDVTQTKRDADRLAALLKENLTSAKAAQDAQLALKNANLVAEAAKHKAEAYRKSGLSADLAKLEAAVEQAKGDLAAARRDLEYSIIRSSCAGKITGLTIEIGQRLEAGIVLARIKAGQRTAIRAELAPKEARTVKLGAAATISLSECTSLTGKVTSIGGAADPDTGLIPVFIEAQSLENSLILGESVLADIITGMSPRGIIVPATALVLAEEAASVVTVDEHQIAHIIPVQILARAGDEIAVKGEGLEQGALVVVEGGYNLPDRAHVVLDTDQK